MKMVTLSMIRMKMMSKVEYPVEILDDGYDNGTMPDNVAELANEIVGHKIVDAHIIQEQEYSWRKGTISVFEIVLDNGKRVQLAPSDDCCAYTQLEAFLLNVELVDHIITGVGTTGGYTTWHIYADYGDILALKVGWSPGNPFYYGYGFNIRVKDIDGE